MQVNRQDVEKTIAEYLKPIFGFALKRCKSSQDAEDLSQEIAVKAFRALLVKDDVADMGKFIWTVAHHSLCNYYRDAAKGMVGVPLDEVAELVADSHSGNDSDDNHAEVFGRFQSEIAYLSKLQRKIVIAYYFENRGQSDIAKELGIPLGTVKWHLFEARKELKRGMETMRKTSELKFNPVKFQLCSIIGSAGKRPLDDFFRSALTQNICYCVRNIAKTVNEIADDLGVSPVYVEGEAEFLAEYGLLQKQKDKYLVNFIIAEPTTELFVMKDKMYKCAANQFANDLYDELTSSEILDSPDIQCNQTDGAVNLAEAPLVDRNFVLWSLIPYIAACSGNKLMEKHISFKEVATIRPDGGHNIVKVSVMPKELILPEDIVNMNGWCGPMWENGDRRILWRIDSEWSERGDHYGYMAFANDAERILSLYERNLEEDLSKDEYVWLAERGCVKTNGDLNGHFKAAWQIVILANKMIQDKLLAIGERLKEKYDSEFKALKTPYIEAMLKTVPAHLRKAQEYELQFIFHSDGMFLLHCLKTLLKNGKLKEPTKEQRKSLSTLILNE